MFTSKMYIPTEKLKDWIKVFWFLEGSGNGKLSYMKILIEI